MVDLKKIRQAYDEAVHCGYAGDLASYVLSVGVDLGDLIKPEGGTENDEKSRPS